MQIEVLVEEPSAEAALKKLLPKILGRTRARIRNLGSKSQLLRKLPSRLAAYRNRIAKGEDLRVVVLVDRDNDDCMALKANLEAMASRSGLLTKSAPGRGGSFHVVNRIAVEELEAWFIGDPEALRAAFTSLPRINPRKGIFRNPDNIRGGTWESLHRFFRSHGIYRSSYPKIEAARKIAEKLSPDRNNSVSFQAFRRGLESLIR